MKTILKLVATSAAGVLCASAVSAATYTYATHVEVIAGTGTGATCDTAAANDTRSDICNSLGAPDGQFPASPYGFTSIGDRTLEYTFGVAFSGASAVWEITGGSPSNHEESLMIWGVTGGGDVVLGEVFNTAATSEGNSRYRIEFDAANGPFSALRVQAGSEVTADNFDIDAIGVTAVPLPAAGLLLVGGLGGLVAMRRRKKA